MFISFLFNRQFFKSNQNATVIFGQFVLAHVNHSESFVAGKRVDSLVLFTLKDGIKHDQSASLFEAGPSKVNQSFEDLLSLSGLDFGPVEFFPVVSPLFGHF
jgi:hypothetical protein